jgi:hypothetical protein
MQKTRSGPTAAGFFHNRGNVSGRPDPNKSWLVLAPTLARLRTVGHSALILAI